jgi:hypothetical protein
MIDFERFNLLVQIGGVSPDVDHIANAQGRTRLKLQGSDGQVAEVVGNDANALARRSGLWARRQFRPRFGRNGRRSFLGRST